MKKIILGFILFLVCSAVSFAKVKLPDIIGDNMVLQQNTKVKLWAKLLPMENCNYNLVNNLTYNGVSDAKGNWVVLVATPKASYQKHEIVINDGEKTTLKNVLIGEVWFCSGQSNMQMPLNGFWNCPIEGANALIATSGQFKHLRVATVPMFGSRASIFL